MTATAKPHFREAGSGPTVICLHSNASTSSQWRALMDHLAATHRVVAVDSYGARSTAGVEHGVALRCVSSISAVACGRSRACTPTRSSGR